MDERRLGERLGLHRDIDICPSPSRRKERHDVGSHFGIRHTLELHGVVNVLMFASSLFLTVVSPPHHTTVRSHLLYPLIDPVFDISGPEDCVGQVPTQSTLVPGPQQDPTRIDPSFVRCARACCVGWMAE